VTAIAAEAGVAVKTVYLAFETKGGILRAVWNLALRGDEGDAPIARREWYVEALEEPDPERQLRLNARNSRAAKTRVGALFTVIRSAALTDADSSALWERIQTEFHDNQRAIVERLADRGALRRELDVTRATDVLWTLNHPDVWQLLVVQRRWSPEAYEAWFGDTAIAQLLAG
jgi:AcrR family transcriptional regulator